MSLSQAILGIKPDYDGLRIEPCLPDELGEYTVERRFRGCLYRIHVVRTGTRSLTLDGRPAEGALIPVQHTGHASVEVTV